MGLRCLIAIAVLALPGSAPSGLPYYGEAYLVAGSGTSGRGDGKAVGSKLLRPQGLALDPASQTLYIADTGNQRICKVDLQSLQLLTLDGGKAFKEPGRIFLQAAGDRLLVEDRATRSLRSLSLSNGAARTLLALDGKDQGIAAWGSGPGPQDLLLLERASGSLYLLEPQGAAKVVGSLPPAQAAALRQARLFVHLGRVYSVESGANTARPLELSALQPPLGAATGPGAPLELGGGAQGALMTTLKLNGVPGLVTWSREDNAFAFCRLNDGQRVLHSPWSLEGVTPLELEKGPRHFFAAEPELAFDDELGIIYAVDEPSHRVIGVPARRWVAAMPEGYGILQPNIARAAPGVQRVLAYGDSFTFFSDNRYDRAETLIGARLQHYWNLFEALAGRPGNREVIVSSMTLHLGADPISRAYYHQKLMEVYEPKEVVLFINYNSLITLVNNFVYRAMPDDLVGPQDTEWAILPEDEKTPHLGPAARQIRALLKEHPGVFEALPEGGLKQVGNAMRLFEDPRYLQAGMSIFGKNLARLKAICDAKGIRLIVVLLPVRNQLGQGELVHGVRNQDLSGLADGLDAAVLAEAARRGVAAVAGAQELQLLAPSQFPLIMAQDDHYMRRTHEILGQIIGYRLSRLADPVKGKENRP